MSQQQIRRAVSVTRTSVRALTGQSHAEARTSTPSRADRRLRRQEILETLLGVRQSGIERSISGMVQDRCEYLGLSSAKCPHCGGAGILGPATQRQQDDILLLIAEWRRSNPGAVHRGEALPRDYGCECTRCKGTGHLEIVETQLPDWPVFAASRIEREGKLTRIVGDWVWERRLTVAPSQTAASGGAQELPNAVVVAQASRALNAVARASLVCAVALGAYYGPPGDRWEARSRVGRLFALYPLTSAGVQLLKRTRDQAGVLTPWERVHSLVALQKPDVVNLLSLAYKQADALLKRAAELWDDQVGVECGRS